MTRPVARARACSISEWRCGHLSEWRVSNRPTMTPNARDAAPFCGVAAVLVRRARKGVVSSKFHRPSERLSRTFAQRSSDLTFVPTSSTIAVWAARPTCGVFLGRGREQARSRPHCTSRLSASCLACSWLIGRWAATARAMRDRAGAGGGDRRGRLLRLRLLQFVSSRPGFPIDRMLTRSPATRKPAGHTARALVQS